MGFQWRASEWSTISSSRPRGGKTGRGISAPLHTSDEFSCPLLSPRNWDRNSTWSLCLSAKTTKFRWDKVICYHFTVIHSHPLVSLLNVYFCRCGDFKGKVKWWRQTIHRLWVSLSCYEWSGGFLWWFRCGASWPTPWFKNWLWSFCLYYVSHKCFAWWILMNEHTSYLITHFCE